MHKAFSVLLALMLFAAAPAPVSAVSTSARDAFYTPPRGWARTAPGTVLRSRPVTIASLEVLPLHVQAWQLLYRTTDSVERPTTTVTTLLRPESTSPTGLISYQIAEDASGPQCAPSATLQRGGGEPLGSLLNQAELVMIGAAVSRGYAVSVPDWEGRGGSLTSPNAGYMALDGIRASEGFAMAGLDGSATKTAAWGYSGGGFATAWTAQAQPRYAPELNLVGAALGGPVTNTGHTFAALNGGPFAGFYPSVLPGVMRGNSVLKRAFGQHLTSAGQRLLADGERHCLTTNLALHPGLNMDHYLDIPLKALMAEPEVAGAFTKLDPGGQPTAPLFVYQAVNDELVFESDTARTVAAWCARGVSVDYVRDEASEHGVLMFGGGPAALDWLAQRLEGSPVAPGCASHTVTSTILTPAGLSSLPSYLSGALTTLLGLRTKAGPAA